MSLSRSWDRSTRVHDHSSMLEMEESMSTESSLLELRHWGLPDSVLSRYALQGVHRMFEWQAKCLMVGSVIEGSSNLVYSAPTSAGKTLVAELLLIKKVVETRKKALLILPFVAIAREKVLALKKLLLECHVRVNGFLGSVSPPGGMSRTDVAVCTIEKANGIINRMLEEKTIDELGIVVVDELHMLGDPSRGYLLELLLTKIRFMALSGATKTQIIGMSATLPNLDLLAEWLDADLFRTDFRPVPLHECIKMGNKLYDNRFEVVRHIEPNIHIPGDSDHLIYLCLEPLLKGHSVLVFCPTKDWCEKLAENISKAIFDLGRSLAKSSAIDNTNSRRNNSIRSDRDSYRSALRKQLDGQKLSEVIEQLKRSPSGLDSSLARCISFGVSYHHAGLTVEERDVVESAFKNLVIRILVATSTLSSGVNLPARRVILRSPFKFQRQLIDAMTYKQMIGRAGRKGIDDEGESILFCREMDRSSVSELVSASLPPVRSCLVLNHGESLANAMKRAILEVVASGIAQSVSDVEKYASCTMLSASMKRDTEKQSDGNQVEPKNPIIDCLDYLRDHELIRLQECRSDAFSGSCGTQTSIYVPTQLGLACLSSSLAPDEGLKVFKELERARKCFVLENELHVLYQIVPINATLKNLNWITYLSMWQALPSDMRRVGELVGVEERFLVRAMRGTISWDKQERLSAIHRRFYTALALHELVNETSLSLVASKYGCSKGELQSLMQLSSIFAAQYQERIEFGVQRELIDLCRLNTLNGQRARVLFKHGFESVALLANAEPSVIETVLHNALPFESKNKVDGETSMALTRRNALRAFWLTGQKGVTLSEAAKMVVEEAREVLQRDLGASVSFDPSQRAQTESIIKEHDAKRRIIKGKKRKSERRKLRVSKRFLNVSSSTRPKRRREDVKYEEASVFTTTMTATTANSIGSLPHSTMETPRGLKKDISVQDDSKFITHSSMKENNADIVGIENRGHGIPTVKEVPIESNDNSYLDKPSEYIDSVNKGEDGESTDVFDDSFVYDLPSILPSTLSRTIKPPLISSCPTTPQVTVIKSDLEFSITPNSTNATEVTCSTENKERKSTKENRGKIGLTETLVSESFLDEMFSSEDPFTTTSETKIRGEAQNNLMMSPIATKRMPLEFEQRSRLTRREDKSSRRKSIAKVEQQRNVIASPECIIFSSDDEDNGDDLKSVDERKSTDKSNDESDELRKVNYGFTKDENVRGLRGVNKLKGDPPRGLFDEFYTKFKGASRVALALASMSCSDVTKGGKEAIGAKILAFKRQHLPKAPQNLLDSGKGENADKGQTHSAGFPLDNNQLAYGLIMTYVEAGEKSLCDAKTLMVDFSHADNLKLLSKMLSESNRDVIFLNAKEAIRQLSTILLTLPRQLKLSDPMTALWMLQPDDDAHTLSRIIREQLPHLVQKERLTIGTSGYDLSQLEKPIRNEGECLERAQLIAHASLWLMDTLELQLSKNGLLKSFQEVEMPLVVPLVRLELNGVGFDETECHRQTSILRTRMEEIEGEAHKAAKRPFRLSSPVEVCRVLYRDLRLPINGDSSLGPLQSPRRGRQRMALSSGKEALTKLSSLHELPNLIMEWRKLDVAITKIVMPMQRCKLYHSCLSHPRVYVTCLSRSGTGRITLQEPNIQCIPKDFELNLSDNKTLLTKALGSLQAECLQKDLNYGLNRSLLNVSEKLGMSDNERTVHCGGNSLEWCQPYIVSLRHAIVAAKGFVVLCADYAQIELRILAHLSADDTLCAWLSRPNFDVFKAIAAEICNTNIDQVTDDQRQKAKQICYGLIYGMGISSLSFTLGVSESQAKLFVDNFRSRFPKVQLFIDATLETCREEFLVRTMDNRLRRMPNIDDKNNNVRSAEERKAVNTVVQGSAADLVKRAMIRIDKELHSRFPASRLPVRLQCEHRRRNGPIKHSSVPNGPGAYSLLQMHDELIYEVSSDCVRSVCSIVKQGMENACSLRVPTPVKIRLGPTWGNVKEIDPSQLS